MAIQNNHDSGNNSQQNTNRGDDWDRPGDALADAWPFKMVYFAVLVGYAMALLTQRNILVWTFSNGAPTISSDQKNFLGMDHQYESLSTQSNFGWFHDFLRQQRTGISNLESSHNNETASYNLTVAFLIPPVLRRVTDSCDNQVPKSNFGSIQTKVTDTVHSLSALANEMALAGHQVLIVAPYLEAETCDGFCSANKATKKKITSDSDTISQAFLESLAITFKNDNIDVYAVPITCEDINNYSICAGVGMDTMRHLKFPFAGTLQNVICSTLPLYSALWTPVTRLGHAVLKKAGKNVPKISRKQRRMDAETAHKHRSSIKDNLDAKLLSDVIDAFVVPQDFLPGILISEKLCIPTIILASGTSLSLLMSEVPNNNLTTILRDEVINATAHRKHRTDPPSWIAAPGSGFRRPYYWYEYFSNVFQQRLINFRFSLAYVNINRIRKQLDLPPLKSLASYFDAASAVLVDSAVLAAEHYGLQDWMFRPHTYMIGPMLHQYHQKTVSSFSDTGVSSWFSLGGTKQDALLGPTKQVTTNEDPRSEVINTQIMVSNFDLRDTSSVQSMITGLNQFRMLLQTYADRVCAAVQEHAVPGSSSYFKLHDECRELTDMANFTVVWVTRCVAATSTVTNSCGSTPTDKCLIDECVPAEIRKFLPNFLSVIHGEQQPFEFYLSPHGIFQDLHQQATGNKKNKSKPKRKSIASISNCSARKVHTALAHRIPVACIPTSREELDVAAQLLDLKLGVVLSSSFSRTNHLHMEEFFLLSNQLSDSLSELLIGKSASVLEEEDPVMIMIEEILPHWEFSSATTSTTTISSDEEKQSYTASDSTCDVSPDEEEDDIFLVQTYRRNVNAFLAHHPLLNRANHGTSQAEFVLNRVHARSNEIKKEWTNRIPTCSPPNLTVFSPLLTFRDWWLDLPSYQCGVPMGESIWSSEGSSKERIPLHIKKGYDLYLMVLAVFILSSTAAVAVCCYLLF